jgi:dethiobiotin synthetase
VPDLLVTGTDTGVGKTVVAAGLVLALRARGLRAVGFKPVETGVAPGPGADSGVLARASGVDEPLARPLLSLPEALAPAVAASRAGTSVDPREIEARFRALRDRHDAVVIEGAGGVAVPLAWDYTVLDLARRLGLPCVVVARAGLGTLNHVWLTVEALGARGIPVAAVVLNGLSSPPDLAEETNPEALARLLPRIRCLVLPRHTTDDPWEVANRLSPLLAGLTNP